MIDGIVVKGKNIVYDDVVIPSDEDAMKDDIWAERAKGLLKAELKRRNLGYRDLAEKLTASGTPESERNLANKISRGAFTASFLLQCLAVIGCSTVHLEPVESI